MKTRPRWFLVGAAALALGACATFCLRRGGVTLHEDYIAVHPGTNISPEDEKQLDGILRQYKSSLYQLKKTEGGQIQTKGRLQDVYVDQALLKGVADPAGVSFWAVQIGDRTIHVDHTIHPDHTIRPDHISHPDVSPKDYEKSLELVRRVTPILKKYSRD